MRSNLIPSASDLATGQIQILELDPSEIDPSSWDNFAQICDASYKCGYYALKEWQIESMALRPRRKMRVFEILARNERKVGQCAIGQRAKEVIFVDALQIDPDYVGLWPKAMGALLARLGPCRCRYGSEWNLEPARERILNKLDGVKIDAVEPVLLQAIDFSAWQTWEAYFSAISQNARRNAKKARTSIPEPSLKVRYGLATLKHMPTLAHLYVWTNIRKGLAASSVHALGLILGRSLGRFVRSITMREHIMTAVARNGKPTLAVFYGALAVFYGMRFGRNVYYLAGGSKKRNGGVAWHLLLTMIENAYRCSGGMGKFVMGPLSSGLTELAKSRKQCRVTDFNTSIVSFSYRCGHRVFSLLLSILAHKREEVEELLNRVTAIAA
jgi:hypothetical protein